MSFLKSIILRKETIMEWIKGKTAWTGQEYRSHPRWIMGEGGGGGGQRRGWGGREDWWFEGWVVGFLFKWAEDHVCVHSYFYTSSHPDWWVSFLWSTLINWFNKKCYIKCSLCMNVRGAWAGEGEKIGGYELFWGYDADK